MAVAATLAQAEAWRRVATLRCGCELIVIDGMHNAVRSTGLCVFHLCRECGDQPAIDAEPDRLCIACMSRAREGIR